MSDDVGLAQRINELINPTLTDVRRVKRGMLPTLEDGEPHYTAHLIRTGVAAIDAQVSLQTLELQFGGSPEPALVLPDDPPVLYVRGRLAGMRALVELSVSGLVIPAEGPEDSDEIREDPLLRPGRASMGYKYFGGSAGVTMNLRRPALAQAYMLAQPGEPRWYLDPDIFREDVGEIVLTDRGRRALNEALAAFRRLLYLACASLLGVVSEAAWYAAADRLAPEGSKLRQHLTSDRTALVQSGVAQILREKGVGSFTLADELLAHASVLREIRNYGVHPANVRDDLERFFTEEECGLLILNTHHYLTSLAGAVRVAMESG